MAPLETSLLRCWAHNPNSLSPKKKRELLARFSLNNAQKPHILFFCETKYGKSVPNINGYYHYHQDRNNTGGGGGACIYVYEDVKTMAVDVPALTSRDIEQVLRYESVDVDGRRHSYTLYCGHQHYEL